MKPTTFAALLPVALASCHAANFSGPLTQASLDDIQSGCGMTAERLVSANPGEKAKISIGGLTPEVGNEQGFTLITQGKCLQDKLADLGIDADVSADFGGSELANKMNAAIDNAVVK